MNSLLYLSLNPNTVKSEDRNVYYHNQEDLPLMFDFDIVIVELFRGEILKDELIREIFEAAALGSSVVFITDKNCENEFLCCELELKLNALRQPTNNFSVVNESVTAEIKNTIGKPDLFFHQDGTWDSLAYFKNESAMFAGFKRLENGVVGIFPMTARSHINETVKVISWWIKRGSPTKSLIRISMLWMFFAILALSTVSYLRFDQRNFNNRLLDEDWLHGNEVDGIYWRLESVTSHLIKRRKISSENIMRFDSNFIYDIESELAFSEELGRTDISLNLIKKLGEGRSSRATGKVLSFIYGLMDHGSFRRAKGIVNHLLDKENHKIIFSSREMQTLHHLNDLLSKSFIVNHDYDLLLKGDPSLYWYGATGWQALVRDNYTAYVETQNNPTMEDVIDYFIIADSFDTMHRENPEYRIYRASEWEEFLDKHEHSEKRDEAAYNVLINLIEGSKKNKDQMLSLKNTVFEYANKNKSSYLADDILYFYGIFSAEVGNVAECNTAIELIFKHHKTSDFFNKLDLNRVKSNQEALKEIRSVCEFYGDLYV